MDTEPTLVNDPRIGFPSFAIRGSLKMEWQALLERREARDLAAHVEHVVQEGLRLRGRNDICAVFGQCNNARHVIHQQHLAVRQLPRARSEHARMGIEWDASLAVARADEV